MEKNYSLRDTNLRDKKKAVKERYRGIAILLQQYGRRTYEGTPEVNNTFHVVFALQNFHWQIEVLLCSRMFILFKTLDLSISVEFWICPEMPRILQVVFCKYSKDLNCFSVTFFLVTTF